MTAPATVAMPPTMTHKISDRVMPASHGRISSGASVCPRNTFAVAESVSGPERRIVFEKSHAMPRTILCRIPR